VNCEICGKEEAEIHHIVFRREATYMTNIKVNHKYLCSQCHRGKDGPHNNKEVDRYYKKQLQEELFLMFKEKDFYNKDDVKRILDISISETIRILKPLKKYKEGFDKKDIIKRLMGGRMYYVKEELEIIDLIEQLK